MLSPDGKLVLKNRQLKTFPKQKNVQDARVIDLAGNPITSFVGCFSFQFLRNLNVDNTKISSFEGAPLLPKLSTFSCKNTPLAGFKKLDLMTIIAFGDSLEIVNGHQTDGTTLLIGKRYRPLYRHFLTSGHVILDISPLRLMNTKTRARKTIYDDVNLDEDDTNEKGEVVDTPRERVRHSRFQDKKKKPVDPLRAQFNEMSWNLLKEAVVVRRDARQGIVRRKKTPLQELVDPSMSIDEEFYGQKRPSEATSGKGTNTGGADEEGLPDLSSTADHEGAGQTPENEYYSDEQPPLPAQLLDVDYSSEVDEKPVLPAKLFDVEYSSEVDEKPVLNVPPPDDGSEPSEEIQQPQVKETVEVAKETAEPAPPVQEQPAVPQPENEYYSDEGLPADMLGPTPPDHIDNDYDSDIEPPKPAPVAPPQDDGYYSDIEPPKPAATMPPEQNDDGYYSDIEPPKPPAAPQDDGDYSDIEPPKPAAPPQDDGYYSDIEPPKPAAPAAPQDDGYYSDIEPPKPAAPAQDDGYYSDIEPPKPAGAAQGNEYYSDDEPQQAQGADDGFSGDDDAKAMKSVDDLIAELEAETKLDEQ